MSKANDIEYFTNISKIAVELRNKLETKQRILLFAYNGTGKTRLSMDFKQLGKVNSQRDTLYFNAFTEDLFTWDNDLDNDIQRSLMINTKSAFFSGIESLAIEQRISKYYNRYSEINFKIDYEKWTIHFSKNISQGEVFTFNQTPFNTAPFANIIVDIKVSRAEENLFIWCFFLAICELAMEKYPSYSWVKYIYIDDPVSSLDDNNAVMLAVDLAQILKQNSEIKTIISSHHTLFFNVMHNELKRALKYYLTYDNSISKYSIQLTGDTPSFHHIAVIVELKKAIENGQLFTYHFNMMRGLIEKSAKFHGFAGCSEFMDTYYDDNDEKRLHFRHVQLLSHANYSLFDPVEMSADNKNHLKTIFDRFIAAYPCNGKLFITNEVEEENK